MNKLCKICGLEKKIMIKCSHCGMLVCLNDFYVKQGLCSDCLIHFYNEYYAEKIEGYCESISPLIT